MVSKLHNDVLAYGENMGTYGDFDDRYLNCWLIAAEPPRIFESHMGLREVVRAPSSPKLVERWSENTLWVAARPRWAPTGAVHAAGSTGAELSRVLRLTHYLPLLDVTGVGGIRSGSARISTETMGSIASGYSSTASRKSRSSAASPTRNRSDSSRRKQQARAGGCSRLAYQRHHSSKQLGRLDCSTRIYFVSDTWPARLLAVSRVPEPSSFSWTTYPSCCHCTRYATPSAPVTVRT